MVFVQISNGDALDKLSILEIKYSRVVDPVKRHYVLKELEVLESSLKSLADNTHLYKSLKQVNMQLWDLENQVRDININDSHLLHCAKMIFMLNTQRAYIKRQINEVTCSELVEVKEHR